jgi:hypothetical protein
VILVNFKFPGTFHPGLLPQLLDEPGQVSTWPGKKGVSAGLLPRRTRVTLAWRSKICNRTDLMIPPVHSYRGSFLRCLLFCETHFLAAACCKSESLPFCNKSSSIRFLDFTQFGKSAVLGKTLSTSGRVKHAVTGMNRKGYHVLGNPSLIACQLELIKKHQKERSTLNVGFPTFVTLVKIGNLAENHTIDSRGRRLTDLIDELYGKTQCSIAITAA